MRGSVIVLALATLALPAFAGADTAYVQSSVSASSDSGGNVVSNGQTVSTGDSSASISTEVTDDPGSGTADVTVETSQDGATTSEHYDEDVSGGQPISITVATSSATTGASATVQVHLSANLAHGATTAALTSATTVSASSSEPNPAAHFLTDNFFRRLRSWFSFF